MALQLINGWWQSPTDPIPANDMDKLTNNAMRIWAYCKQQGWTAQACAGMLGNFWGESRFNPAVWQNYTIPADPYLPGTSKGYGLAQWTGYSKIEPWKGHHKYTYWCYLKGLPYDQGTSNMYYLFTEDEHSGNWQKSSWSDMTFDEYSHSTLDVRFLARAFYHNYIRSAAGWQEYRADQAEIWYGVITTNPVPVVPPLPITPKVSAWLLFQFNTPKRVKRRLIL